jgi:hypothetical protein
MMHAAKDRALGPAIGSAKLFKREWREGALAKKWTTRVL